MIVLEPTGLASVVHGALAESVALRLELEQRAWLRAGRDIVGRCVSVSVAKNRFGPPGRETEIEIRYLAEGELAQAVDRFAVRDRDRDRDREAAHREAVLREAAHRDREAAHRDREAAHFPSPSNLATLIQSPTRRLSQNRLNSPSASQRLAG